MRIFTHTDTRRVYIRKHVRTHTSIYVYTQTLAVCIHAIICKHTHTHMYTRRQTHCIYLRKYTHTHTYICTHTDSAVYTYVNLYAHTCMSVHTKTNAVCIHVDNRRVHVRKDTRENAYIYTHRPTLCVYINIYTHTCLYEHTQTRCVHIQKHLHIPTHIFTHRQKPCVFTKIHTPTHTHTHAYKHKQNSRVWKSPEELENQPDIIKYIHACNSQSHPQLVMEPHDDVSPRCRRPLPFPRAYQQGCDVSRHLYQVSDRRAEVYGSGERCGSTMQTTITISAGASERIPRCTKGRDLWIGEQLGSTMQTTTAFSAEHTSKDATSRGTCTRVATKGRSLWIGEAKQLHDADDHCHFRWRASKDATR